MKLLLISLQKNGAAPRDSLEFSNALCELKTPHDIIISRDNELRKNFISNDYRTVIAISTFATNPLSALLASLTLVRPLRLCFAIMRSKPDIVFSTHFHIWLRQLIFLRPMLKFKWFYATHENPFADKEQGNSLLKKFERTFLKRADRIFCYSEYIKTYLEAYIASPIVVLPLGAYSTAFVGVKADPRFTQKTKPLLLFIGRLEPYKGLHALISAFELMKQRKIAVDLLIAGRGEIGQELGRRIKDAGIILENRWLTTEEISSYVLAADLLVLPYVQASQSGVIPLALAAGKPVLSTTVGGLSEQVDDGVTGRLVTPGNPHAFAEAIQEMIANPEKLTEMGLQARVLGSTRLSWKRAGEIFLGSLS